MKTEDLRLSVDKIDLRAGDMLVDSIIGSIGILMSASDDHDNVGYYYDSRFWKIFWVSPCESYYSQVGEVFVEEYGLKMSIVIGIYEHYQTSGLTQKKKI